MNMTLLKSIGFYLLVCFGLYKIQHPRMFKENGEFKCYDINGNFKGSGIYRDGEPWEGYLINTNDENNLEEGLYEKGKRKGEHIILNRKGEIIGKKG